MSILSFLPLPLSSTSISDLELVTRTLSPSPKLATGNIGNWQHYHIGNILNSPFPSAFVFFVYFVVSPPSP